ncbi:aminotransferase class IV family protein [Streptomyces zhaozhouensis]|nr:aminotransferase class IV family protein [Streptomyces zhaozhouensis]
MMFSLTQFNGRPATVEDLAPLAFAGHAHFTAFQVRDHAVRGLDLHLDRLRTASDTLFGRSLPDERITAYLRAALETAGPDCSLTCYLTTRPGEFALAGDAAVLDVLVRATDPVRAPVGPVALDLVRHERHLPGVKHVGEVAKTRFMRRAHANGFDDAAFEDRTGRLSEATIWNLAFWDGESVIWPDADRLPGVTMRILSRRLRARGVPQRTRAVRRADLDGLAAVVMNSWSPGVPVSRIGDRRLVDDPAFVTLLGDAYADEPPTRP